MKGEKNEIFHGINASCCMGWDNCVCGNEERVIRGYIRGGEITSPMSEAQREYCISTADWAGEGHYERKELSAMNDKELASALLNAWIMYAQSQY